MIEVQNLSKSFRVKRGRQITAVPAVVNVSFQAQDGRITALLGPNGAGKTTTLRVLATMMQASGGRALVGGLDVSTHAVAAREQLGVLSDARGLYMRLTGRENIAYYAQLRNLAAHQWQPRLEEIAHLLDMSNLLDRPTQGFSSGERMKIALARALIHDPQHLILDEPTNGLDVMSTRALRRLLLALRERGKCIIFSTHIMQEVEAICDEIVIIAAGRSVARGHAANICSVAQSNTLEDAFVKLALAHTHHGEQALQAVALTPPTTTINQSTFN